MAFVGFDGNQGRIEALGYTGIAGFGDRSVFIWINTSREDCVLCWWGTDPSGPIQDGAENSIRLVKGHVQLFGRGSFRESATYVADSTPRHIVVTWSRKGANLGHADFSIANIYINGVLDNGRQRGGDQLKIRADGSETTDIEIDTAQDFQVMFGARPSTTPGVVTDGFLGAMDDVAIYDTVLSPGTIVDIYNGGFTGVDLSTLGQYSSIELWYKMGDGAGDTAGTGGTIHDQQTFVPSRDGSTFFGTGIIP